MISYCGWAMKLMRSLCPEMQGLADLLSMKCLFRWNIHVLSIAHSNYVAGYQLPEEFLFDPLIGLSSVIKANFGDPIVQKYWYTNSSPMFQLPSWVVLVMWLYPRALKLLRLSFILAQLCRDCCIKQKTVTMIKHSGSVCIIDNVCLSTIILEDIITIS